MHTSTRSDMTALDLQLYVRGTMHGTVRTLVWEILPRVHLYISSCGLQDTRPKYKVRDEDSRVHSTLEYRASSEVTELQLRAI